jgi:hypothetical protein
MAVIRMIASRIASTIQVVFETAFMNQSREESGRASAGVSSFRLVAPSRRRDPDAGSVERAAQTPLRSAHGSPQLLAQLTDLVGETPELCIDLRLRDTLLHEFS